MAAAFRLTLVLAFWLLYLSTRRAWQVPAWVAGLYIAASAMCFALYALDKSAAMTRRRRVPERTLLALSLAGGWPGALLAQAAFRHKVRKASFRLALWSGAAINVAAFVALGSGWRWGG